MTTKFEKIANRFDRRQLLLGTALAAATTVGGPWIRKAGAAGLEKFKLCSWSPRLAEEGNIFVSEEKGYFKDEGLEIEWPGFQLNKVLAAADFVRLRLRHDEPQIAQGLNYALRIFL